MADKRTYVHWAEKKYDVVVFGMPTNFHYGDGMGTNPIQMMQALSAQVIRHKRVLSDHCVFIVSSICDGWFHEERWPYLRELYEMFQHDYMNILPDMNRYGEYFATNEEYIRKYRFANAFHPFHGFSMMSCGHLAEEHTSAIYIVGAREPGIARGMGLKTRATFEEALAGRDEEVRGPQPQHPGPAPDLHHCRRAPVHEGPQPEQPYPRLRPRSSLRRLKEKKMIQFQYTDESKIVSEEAFHALLAESAEMLERCKRGEAKYADSLGWLNVDE